MILGVYLFLSYGKYNYDYNFACEFGANISATRVHVVKKKWWKYTEVSRWQAINYKSIHGDLTCKLLDGEMSELQ
jgi:hypothetical protein